MRDFDAILDLFAAERALAIRFWATFSRFEFALKHGGFAHGNQDGAFASWDVFANTIAPHFDDGRTQALKAAVDYLEQNPPQKQVLDAAQHPVFVPNVRPGNEPRLQSLLIHIRTIRNNLFHGGKFPTAPPVDPDRDDNLLQSGLVILDECLTLADTHCNQVSHWFDHAFAP